MTTMRSIQLTTVSAALLVACGVLMAATPASKGKAAKADAPKGLELTPELVGCIHGTFDMSKNPRPYIVYMVLDQTNNIYPSFWCGGNAGGKITFSAKLNELDGTMEYKQTGSFTVQLGNAPRKYGMDDVLPGGAWIAKLRENKFQVTFERFDSPVIVSAGGGTRGEMPVTLLTVNMAIGGTVSVADRKAPFAGTATMVFSDTVPTFSLHARFPFPGKELGLEGAKGEGMTATLCTASVIEKSSAPDGRGKDVMSGLGDAVKDE